MIPEDLKKLAFETTNIFNVGHLTYGDRQQLSKTIESALQKVRNDTIDECADKVNNWVPDKLGHIRSGIMNDDQISRSVRALKEKK